MTFLTFVSRVRVVALALPLFCLASTAQIACNGRVADDVTSIPTGEKQKGPGSSGGYTSGGYGETCTAGYYDSYGYYECTAGCYYDSAYGTTDCFGGDYGYGP